GSNGSWETLGRAERRGGRGGRPFFHRKNLGKQQLRFNADSPVRKMAPPSELSTVSQNSGPSDRYPCSNESQFPNPPSYPYTDGAGSRRKALRSRPGLGTEAVWSAHDVRRLPRVLRVRQREPLCDE